MPRDAAAGLLLSFAALPARGGPAGSVLPRQEIAIDAFPHTVYALVTGLAYELVDSRVGHA
jgi:hypothetical protein